jgi:aminopeptidase N
MARAAAHFANARNATDEISALNILSEQRAPERAEALERFYERWKGDHLVIDHWFACQAASPLASTMATVRKLTGHPLFSLQNPNKVRALIGTFASANLVSFNRPDGQGYNFVADHVLQIDAFNPQIAARLLSAFRSWKALEPGRRRQARKALQRVAKAKPLSRDVFEVVSKMLE